MKINLSCFVFVNNVFFSDARDLQSFLLLHTVLQPTLRLTTKTATGGKGTWVPTIKNAQDSTVLLVSTINDVDNQLEQLRQRCLLLGLTLQPLIVAVGPDATSATVFVVYYQQIKYKLTSFLKALDICFKIFHVFNLEYPKEGYWVWLFVQKFLYCIDTPYDKTNSKFITFLTDCKTQN